MLSAFVPLIVVLTIVLTACSGGSSTNTQPPVERLAAAKKSFDMAPYIGFAMKTDSLPSGTNGLLSAHGTGTHKPAFTGEVEVKTQLTFTAPLIAIGSIAYVKLPFTGWSRLNPSDYGAPNPAALMNRSTGISALFTATKNPSAGQSERSGSEILTNIKGALPGPAVHRLFPSSDTQDFSVTYTLSDNNEIHTITITGPFYNGHPPVTYTIDLDLHAAPVTIKAPQT
ncbi:MAG: LppX_LprAFG lipoprotein [Nocardioidaceae bacterium]